MFDIEFDVNHNETVVFSTSKTLNERFTRKKRCVFVINNGYTAPYKNNKINDRIILKNRAQVKFQNKLYLYERNTAEESYYSENEDKNKLKQELEEYAKKRRVVLMPTKLVNEESVVDSLGEEGETSIGMWSKCNQPDVQTQSGSYRYQFLNDDQMSKQDCPKSKARRKKISKRCWNRDPLATTAPISSYGNSNNSDESIPIVYSPYFNKNSRYNPQSLYKWKREPPNPWDKRPPATKEELDQELDDYMSETVFKRQSPVVENVDVFVEEYTIESEKFFENDISDLEILYSEE